MNTCPNSIEYLLPAKVTVMLFRILIPKSTYGSQLLKWIKIHKLDPLPFTAISDFTWPQTKTPGDVENYG